MNLSQDMGVDLLDLASGTGYRIHEQVPGTSLCPDGGTRVTW